ncbi:methyltransferase [Marinobacterium sp. AK62]|uniref:Methyltransferase n=1 Tax=Marinobacterium alkalitolerans TaxID=1542925 RepID=A0ABS3Z8B6_9GAMM|nr:methyltransferase [Marinobacterium alkalitolerans]MBP0047966.1 methyltransferase [Marinobacterium alkalitolerans]
MSAPSLNEALALMHQHAFTAAAAVCRQHLASRPRDFNALHLLGLIQLKSGQHLAATKSLQQAAQLPVQNRFRAQALSNLSLALQARGRLKQAGEALQQAITLQPEELAFHLNLLGVLEKTRDWSAIHHHLAQTPVLAHHPEARLCHAVALRHLTEYEQALEKLSTLDASIEAEPEYALNLCLAGRVQEVLEQAQHKDTPSQWLTQVADYIAEEGHARLATPLYEAVFAQEPDNASVRHMLDAAAGRCTAAAPDDYVQALYDQHADAFEERLTHRLGYNAPRLLAEQVAKLLPAPSVTTVLDLGCGTGLCGEALLKAVNAQQMIGCDLSSKMLAHARAKGIYTELNRSGLIEALAASSHIDLITATDVLIYTGDLNQVLTAAYSALMPGGLFAFTIETTTSPAGVELDSSGRYRHNPDKLAAQSETVGLEVCYQERFPLRREHDAMLEGALMILRKPDAA